MGRTFANQFLCRHCSFPNHAVVPLALSSSNQAGTENFTLLAGATLAVMLLLPKWNALPTLQPRSTLRKNPEARARTFSVPEKRGRLDSGRAVNSVELPATGYVEWLAGEAVLITFASAGFHPRMETFFAFARLLKRERERLKRTVQNACQADQPCDRPLQTELPVDPPESLRLASACQSLDH